METLHLVITSLLKLLPGTGTLSTLSGCSCSWSFMCGVAGARRFTPDEWRGRHFARDAIGLSRPLSTMWSTDHFWPAYSPVRTAMRSEERRVVKECVITFITRWSPYIRQKKPKKTKQ